LGSCLKVQHQRGHGSHWGVSINPVNERQDHDLEACKESNVGCGADEVAFSIAEGVCGAGGA